MSSSGMDVIYNVKGDLSYSTPKKTPNQLIVLGMHHSATSVLSRIIIMMGIYGGEVEDFLIKKTDPRKFWERGDVVKLEQWVINQVVPAKDHEGPRWTAYAYDESKVNDLISSKFGLEAKKIVEKLDKHKPWFTKDPRMCLMFDLWKPYLDEPSCLIVYRHPVVLAKRSQTRFEGLKLVQWIQLWENYTISALKSCIGVPTTLVSQSHLEDDAYSTIEKFYYELGRLGFNITNSSLPNLPPPSKSSESLSTILQLPSTSLQLLRLPTKQEVNNFLFPPDQEPFPPRPPISEKELRLLSNSQVDLFRKLENYFNNYPTLDIPPTKLAASLLPNINPKPEGYVVLVTSNNPSYAVGAVVIGNALQIFDGKRDQIALVLPDVSKEIRSILQNANFIVKEIEPMEEVYIQHNSLCQENQAEMDASRRQRWGKMFSKLRIWELEEYSRLIYLDCDCLPHESITKLWESRKMPMMAEAGTMHHGFNAGFMIFEPSKRLFNEMVDTLETQKKTKTFPNVFNNILDCTEQSFLNDFFPYFEQVNISRAHNSSIKGIESSPLSHWITTKCPKPWSAKCSIARSCNPIIYDLWWKYFESIDQIFNQSLKKSSDKKFWESLKKEGTVAHSVCQEKKRKN